MKSFSNSTIYPILPYNVWKIIVRFYYSPDFTILSLLPYAIMDITFPLSDSFNFTDYKIFLGTRLKNEVVYNYVFLLWV